MPFDPITQDEFLALPPEKQLTYLRAVDAAQPRKIDTRPLNPLPSTIDALRAECERQRTRIVDAMRKGQIRFYPGTDANFLAALQGKISGFAFKPLERLWRAAVVLDVGNRPPFPGEPQTGLEIVAALDGLLAALSAGVDDSTRKTPIRRRAGRPVDTDVKQDQKLYDAWQTRSYRTYRELASAFSLTERQAKRAVDRERKRRK